jgi:hypothetical protein
MQEDDDHHHYRDRRRILMSAATLTTVDRRRYAILLWGITAAWFAAVVIGAQSGFFASLWLPLIAAIVASSIILPTLWYYASPKLRAFIDHIGHRRIMLMHAWRVPAALLFFWYGLQGQLPFWFWFLAGTGDFIAGSYALWLSTKPEDVERYRSFHRIGFADFVVAVGTGLTFTLLQDPLIAPIATLPLALIPLFGVGISGASHLMAFDMLRRGTGFLTDAPLRPATA